MWLKAAGRDTAFEAGLYELLHRVAPDRVLTPLAVDTSRAWILLPDGGPSLGECLKGDPLMAALEQVLPEYGTLQRELAPHADEMLVLGVPDMRPARMPARFEEALDAAWGYAGEADREGLARVAALRETVDRWCEELAAAPGAPSPRPQRSAPVEHPPLRQARRVLRLVRQRVRHPFARMLVLSGSPEPRRRADVTRLRDGYLEASRTSPTP